MCFVRILSRDVTCIYTVFHYAPLSPLSADGALTGSGADGILRTAVEAAPEQRRAPDGAALDGLATLELGGGHG